MIYSPLTTASSGLESEVTNDAAGRNWLLYLTMMDDFCISGSVPNLPECLSMNPDARTRVFSLYVIEFLLGQLLLSFFWNLLESDDGLPVRVLFL